MKLDFFDEFTDPYLKTNRGKGVFLAGVTLGVIARAQAKSDLQGSSGDISSSPLFKQLNFGRMKKRDLFKHLARVPELVRAYRLDYADMIESLCAKAGELILQKSDKEHDLGVDGNFVFSVAFLNARKYFWTIFGKKNIEETEPIEEESQDVV
ncbi:TM1802 family CRISPR-associated protein [Acetomicrobium sp.]|jgi:hypothetical protein|uniref:TM1802 family CRISPR-associated protein n=1 Tax=Acetomicrobium sp. TaxID=1872099 RepID=UPI0016A1A0BA|nr:TM1802 family CRISPR-associated protein [Acetomicrobium sp.]MDR9768833.1 TM1802 family CRISPR-associated protein [Acetomicrobium sp.]NLI42122.1 CRISPR-associated protein [Synergistaceae bacterium]HUM42929.1 TM1802 family CRISPR-associated protein [Fervidobacterium sp.]